MMETFQAIWDAYPGDLLRGIAEDGLMWVTAAGLAAAPLAVVVLAINFLGRRWLTAGQMGLLWCLVLVRLLMPCAPASPFSLHNLWPQDRPPAFVFDFSITDIAFDMNGAPAIPITAQPILALRDSPPDPTAEYFDWLTATLKWLWLALAIVILGWTLFAHYRFCRRLRRTPVCRDERLLRLVDECCTLAGLRNPLPVVVFAGVEQPAVIGLLRTELLLPAHALDLSDEELKMVLLHELAHVRRWDLAVNWGLVVLRALHWWNPIYWLAATRYQSLREQACDAFVLRTVADGQSRDYGELLLNLASHSPPNRGWRVMLPSSLLGILNGFWRKRTLRVRLRALRSAGFRPGRWQQCVAGCLLLGGALCGWTDSQLPAGSTEGGPLQTHLQLESIDWNHWHVHVQDQIPNQPLQARTYPVGAILKHAERDGATPAQYLREIELFANHIVKTASRDKSHPLEAEAETDDAVASPGCRLYEESLIVQAAPAVHERLATLLHAFEQSGMAQICVESRLITSRIDLANAVGAQWTTSHVDLAQANLLDNDPAQESAVPAQVSVRLEDHVPILVARLKANQLPGMMQTLQGDQRSNIMFSPKITLFNGQQATIADRIRRPFVVGYDTSTPGQRLPRVEVTDEGTAMTFQTVARPDRKHVQLSGAIDLTSIVDVETVSTAGEAGTIAVQVPRVRRCRLAVNSEVEHDQPLLIGYVPNLDRKEFVYVVLIARVLDVAP
jgi:beta-lactamase regulating signal transducer with metallopeptidase domain